MTGFSFSSQSSTSSPLSFGSSSATSSGFSLGTSPFASTNPCSPSSFSLNTSSSATSSGFSLGTSHFASTNPSSPSPFSLNASPSSSSSTSSLFASAANSGSTPTFGFGSSASTTAASTTPSLFWATSSVFGAASYAGSSTSSASSSPFGAAISSSRSASSPFGIFSSAASATPSLFRAAPSATGSAPSFFRAAPSATAPVASSSQAQSTVAAPTFGVPTSAPVSSTQPPAASERPSSPDLISSPLQASSPIPSVQSPREEQVLPHETPISSVAEQSSSAPRPETMSDQFLQSIKDILSDLDQLASASSLPPLSPIQATIDLEALRDVLGLYASLMTTDIGQAALPENMLKLEKASSELDRLMGLPVLPISAEGRLSLQDLQSKVMALILRYRTVHSQKAGLLASITKKDRLRDTIDNLRQAIRESTDEMVIEESLLLDLERQLQDIQRQIEESSMRRDVKKRKLASLAAEATTTMAEFKDLARVDFERGLADLVRVDAEMLREWQNLGEKFSLLKDSPDKLQRSSASQ